MSSYDYVSFFFFNNTATPEISTLSLHDALPISAAARRAGPLPRLRDHRRLDHRRLEPRLRAALPGGGRRACGRDRKSTRLNSSHANISYAVFCLKKKKHSKYYGSLST